MPATNTNHCPGSIAGQLLVARRRTTAAANFTAAMYRIAKTYQRAWRGQMRMRSSGDRPPSQNATMAGANVPGRNSAGRNGVPTGSSAARLQSAQLSAKVRPKNLSNELRHWRRDSLEERSEVVAPIVPHAVDEESGRSIDAALHAAHEVIPHFGAVRTGVERAAETVGIEAQLPGVFDQVVILERELPLEQPVVHLPERALRTGGLGRLGGVLGLGVDLRQREVAEDKPQPRAELLLHFLHDRVGVTAVRALEIAVLHHGERRILCPARVIPRAHRHGQVRAVFTPAHGPLPAAAATRAPRECRPLRG